MVDFLEYSGADFLLFAPATYWRLFEQLNGAVWPLQPLLVFVSALLCIVAGSVWRRAGLVVGFFLATFWTVVAQLFFATYYQPINWAVAWVTPVVWLQVGLCIVLAPGLTFSERRETPYAAYALIALAFAYPLIGVLVGRPLLQSEVAGLAPDPTALVSLGLFGLARQGWRRIILGVLPAIWLIVSATTLMVMNEPSAWILVLGLFLWMVTHFQRS